MLSDALNFTTILTSFVKANCDQISWRLLRKVENLPAYLFQAGAKEILVLVCFVIQEGTAFFPGSSLAGNGLLVSDGPIWQRQRQLSNPAFRQYAVETYAKVPAHVRRSL